MGFWSTIKNVGGAIGNAALGLGSSIGSQAMNWAYQKKAMALQQKYWQQQYDTQRKDALQDYSTQRADYLNDLLNSRVRDVQSLKSAGLNPSLASEQSVGGNSLGATIQQSNGSGLNPAAPQTSFDASTSMLFDLQRKQLQANIRKTEVDTERQMNDTQRIRAEFENWKDNLPILNETLKQTLSNMKTDKAAKESEISKQSVEIDKILADIDNVTFQTYKAQELLPYERNKIISSISADIASANSNNASAKLSEIKQHFSALGIGIGNDMITSLVAILSSPNGKDLFNQIMNNLKGLASSIGDAVQPTANNVVNDVKEQAENIPFTAARKERNRWISDRYDELSSYLRKMRKGNGDSPSYAWYERHERERIKKYSSAKLRRKYKFEPYDPTRIKKGKYRSTYE